MKGTAKALLAIAVKAAVILFSYTFLTPYLVENSQGGLSHKAASLPVIVVAGSLLVGLLLGLWLAPKR